jgi:hypothetical protein
LPVSILRAFTITPLHLEYPIKMDKIVAPPVVTIEKMPDGLFIHFADGRFAFYSYDLLYATIETAQVVSPEMNDTIYPLKTSRCAYAI